MDSDSVLEQAERDLDRALDEVERLRKQLDAITAAANEAIKRLQRELDERPVL